MDILTLGKISAVKRETDKKIKDLDVVVTTALTATTDLVDTNIALAVTNLNTALTDTTNTLTTAMTSVETGVAASITTVNNDLSTGLSTMQSGVDTDIASVVTTTTNAISAMQTQVDNATADIKPGAGCIRFFGSNNLCCAQGKTGKWQAHAHAGCCCHWTAPAGTKAIRFELTGGGGSVGGSCCCMGSNLPGGSGAYSNKTVYGDLGGCTYSICAGGGRCCYSASGSSHRGHTTYVNGHGTGNLCAIGGHAGQSRCWYYCSACCNMCTYCAAGYGADFVIGGQSSWKSSGRHQGMGDVYGVSAGVPGPMGAGPMHSADSCTTNVHNHGMMHGQGGLPAFTHWPCCCSRSSGAGLVQVTYW
jgi:hypothetical protein